MNQQGQINSAEFEALKAELTPIVSVTVQEAYGGYIVNGTIEWKQGINTVVVQRDAAVAFNNGEVGNLVDRYLSTYAFDKQSPDKDQ